MSESHPNDDHQAFRNQLIQALDDLVATMKVEGAKMQAGIAHYEERKRRGDFDMRERPPEPYGSGSDGRFDRLNERFDELANHLSDMSRDLSDVKRDLADVKSDLAGVKSDLAGVKSDLAGVKSDLAGVKGEVSGIKSDLADVKREVTGIRERMATKVELEETNDNVKKIADGYATTRERLDTVAEMLKAHGLVR